MAASAGDAQIKLPLKVKAVLAAPHIWILTETKASYCEGLLEIVDRAVSKKS